MHSETEITRLRRLARDTARLAVDHPCMNLARHSMSVITRCRSADNAMWIDDAFENWETILSDIESVTL